MALDIQYPRITMVTHRQERATYAPSPAEHQSQEAQIIYHPIFGHPITWAEYMRLVSGWHQSGIIYCGEGMITAGQSPEYFVHTPQHTLCYQCCKRIPYRTLWTTRNEPCGETSCSRTQQANLPFIPMPPAAADACDSFRAQLLSCFNGIDCGAVENIVNRAKALVEQARDGIQ
ncbi:hypothetical protein RRF57_001620 [Xylaria bambusicola]|uniref:Uncharacterized protein n=1 Tax=Xylaria bambusicola TaxID=326684 RepID=A0AAN7UH97_9PEZI